MRDSMCVCNSRDEAICELSVGIIELPIRVGVAPRSVELGVVDGHACDVEVVVQRQLRKPRGEHTPLAFWRMNAHSLHDIDNIGCGWGVGCTWRTCGCVRVKVGVCACESVCVAWCTCECVRVVCV